VLTLGHSTSRFNEQFLDKRSVRSEFLTSRASARAACANVVFWTTTCDHLRTLPQGGGCAAPKRCPGCGGRAGAKHSLGAARLVRPSRPRSHRLASIGPYTEARHGDAALPALRRAERLYQRRAPLRAGLKVWTE